jgi:hypothetical protein
MRRPLILHHRTQRRDMKRLLQCMETAKASMPIRMPLTAHVDRCTAVVRGYTALLQTMPRGRRQGRLPPFQIGTRGVFTTDGGNTVAERRPLYRALRARSNIRRQAAFISSALRLSIAQSLPVLSAPRLTRGENPCRNTRCIDPSADGNADSTPPRSACLSRFRAG